ncbi:MAG: CDP-diacylglycerol--glycerol-3-phosphate 3-phosphatidyltransferase [Gammaproteobacteria bacterium]|jgi:CDP-diacylglycerol--glycerol-3-phosphate 3-phosphatidyltransferase|nr:CDP-diacylglycerol--glycerol-3-phosphate 3-phosphatidyltransferase [Gammaproteobacteria bacterium]
MTIPTSLTLFRIALIPVFVLVFYLPLDQARLWTVIIFTLAAVTDWLDGYLARRLNQTSAFGAFLDPVADKLMVAVALVLLLEASPSPGLAIPAAVIIGREIAVSALRERMAEMGQGSAVAVNMAGKIKTTCQMIAIILLLYGEPLFGFPTTAAGYVLLNVAAALTLWSMFIYLARAWPTLRGSGGGA